MASIHRPIRTDGLPYAVMRPDSETHQHLHAIALSNDTEVVRGGSFPFEQSTAMQALGALGQERALVEGLLKWGSAAITEELVEICAQNGAMGEEALSSAKDLLHSDDISIKRNALIALGLSGRTEWISTFKRDRELLPNFLMEVDSTKAIPQLCSHAKREKSTQVRWQIARALCAADDIDSVVTRLRAMVTSVDESSRMAGSELAGWLTPGLLENELRTLVLTEPSLNVRATARESLRRQRETLLATRLANELSTVDGCQRWCYVMSAVEIANPYLLLHEKDPIGFRNACKKLPASIIQYVRDQLDRRMKQLDQQAEAVDRNRKSLGQ